MNRIYECPLPSRTDSRLSFLGESGRPWEEDVEHAWINAPEDGPGAFKVGIGLSHDFLSSLIARRPWCHQRWACD